MTRTRFKTVLFVTSEISSPQLCVDYKNIKYVHSINQIFPSIYDFNPTVVLLDHSFLNKDVEKVVRRLRGNTFYNKIKICCYKSKVEPKADSLLKAIGVDYFIYEEELQATQKSKNILGVFTEMFDRSVIGMLTNVSN